MMPKNKQEANHSCRRPRRQNSAIHSAKYFFGIAELKAIDIFSSPNSKVRIVITTCNTSHLLRGYGYKPKVNLTDEAAIGSEPDVLIGLNLGATKIQLSEDHKQSTPVVRSEGHSEQSRQVSISLFERFFGHYSFDLVRLKINSTQGGENEIVLLGLTPADQYNGAIIGFSYKWNRMNVTITGAKSCLIVFGNLDLWRSQLAVITPGYRARNFGCLMIDLLDLGDVIGVEGENFLPRSHVELRDGRSAWPMEIEKTLAQDSRLSCHGQSIMNSYTTQEANDMHEQQLLLKPKAFESSNQGI